MKISTNDLIKAFLLAVILVIATPEMVLANSALKTKSAGRKPASSVKYRQSGVPVFDMVQKKGSELGKVKNIPKLDIGEEKEIEASSGDFSITPKKEFTPTSFKKMNSAPRVVVPEIKVTKLPPATKITTESSLAKIPAVKILTAVTEPSLEDPATKLENLVEIKPDEYKMLQALIYLEYHKKFDLAMSLFVELMLVKEYRLQALFHYAQTAFELGLYSEFRQKMIQVTQEAKEPVLKKLATENLAKNIAFLPNSDVGLIDPLVESFNIDVSTNENYSLKRAKYFVGKGDLGQVESSLVFISDKSPLYPEASLLKAVFNYRRGQLEAAISDLELSWPAIEGQNKNQIRNLSALTLARLYFQKGDYKLSHKTYLKIDKSSSSWIQGMIEQSWTQILAGDYEGAAGNMFSLHSDYFRKVYAPDTYIVRTVGYLNLCQYGDGVNVLNDLKKRYSGIQNTLENYKKANRNPDQYYELVKTWLLNSKLDEVDGIPKAFIAELARHPHFTTLQKQINTYEDENIKFNKITIDMIHKEKEARLRMLKTKNDYLALKRENAVGPAVQAKEQLFLAAGVEHAIASRAREGLKKVRLDSVARLEKEKDVLRAKASKNLQSRFNDYVASLGNLVDQKDVLTYEIYSGAGDHIRFQMAGGKISERDTASLAASEKESYSWKHAGEVWDDELGHYRSALKNVCPSDEVAQSKGNN